MAKPDPTETATQLLLTREIAQVLEKHGVVAQVQLCDQNGQPLSAAELAPLQAELRVAQQKIEHLRRLSSITSLAAGVTHDARNLLTGSLGFTQLLRSKAHDAVVVQETARTIETELRRCVDVIASFLNLSRAGVPTRQELDVIDVIVAVERLVAYHVRHRGCTLRISLEQGLPKLLGRAGDLQRVLINLIVNAADAAQGLGGQILLNAQTGPDSSVELRVQDDGPGVPAAIAQRIFEPFFSTKDAGEGTGLGLSISRSIAEAHGGTLFLESSPNMPGATFVLRLPALGNAPTGRPQGDEEEVDP
ncbi:MAG TPA: HAMP domain-containing sensor histidine kinase [Polyangiales bacterium]|nr:HAMP domain-containing sensor histidine kinase [Polyangiales bacterium]